MNNNIMGIVAFLLLLALYTTVLFVIGSALPLVFLVAVAVWLILRRPMHHPGRLEADLRTLELKAGDIARKLMEVLVRPLVHGL